MIDTNDIPQHEKARKPSVCIMIPTYNQSKYIGKAVESALAQDYPNLEIVIADDNSTEDTAAVLGNLLQKTGVKYFKNPVNLGRVANYNKCLNDYTKSEWVINLDGDDYYTNPHFISQAIEAIGETGYDSTLFYQGVNVMKMETTERILKPAIKGVQETFVSEDYFFKFFDINYFSHMSTLYNRQKAITSKFYDMNVLSADIYSMLRLALDLNKDRVIISNNISGNWFIHHTNASKSTSLKEHLDNFKLYIKLYRLAREKGFNGNRCRQWLLKAFYKYFRSYTYRLIISFKK